MTKVADAEAILERHPEVKLCLQVCVEVIVRAARNYSQDESIIPKKRKAAFERFTRSQWFSEVMSDTNNWPRAHALLKAQTRERTKALFTLMAVALIGDSLCAILVPSQWAAGGTNICAVQFILCVNYYVPRVPDIFLLKRWERIWQGSVLNSSRGVAFEQTAATREAPKNAQYLLWLVLPRGQRRDAISELNDQFEIVLDEHGLRRAQFFFWWEVARSCRDASGPFVMKLLGVGIIAEIIRGLRRYIGF